ncbi:hypothetical protein SUGI_0145980 [Cryptomeria japonica]|uniref:photosystem I reaction center subunit III, chloroplastic n=1 Tax=Cryptomeria japonica TaxID=3369 RepID=UPI002408B3FB|nr:photosystem I reaction center subunit III, chloroplastic [Cryptomeria japonica]GLJ11191.1 hypothetical protein SUGI_0145980 [Cryptomeria japonica]
MAGVSVPTGLMKPLAGRSLGCRTPCRVERRVVMCSASEGSESNKGMIAFGKKMSTALALAAVMTSGAAVGTAQADIAGLTPCKESKAFEKREKQALKKLQNSLKAYAPESAPALAIKASIEKTKRRFDNYGKEGLLCGTDGLPHLIVDGDQAHWGEFITPGLLFLYIAGWIGWVGRSYLIAVRAEKKPTEKEIILDVPLYARIIGRGFIWPLAAANEFLSGKLIEDDANITVSPR